MSRLSELRALLDAATPGPWETDATQGDAPVIYVPLPDVGVSVLFEADWGTDADAALIADAPEALALLLTFADEVKAACSPARGTPPDVWGATKDDVIEDVHAALARMEGTS